MMFYDAKYAEIAGLDIPKSHPIPFILVRLDTGGAPYHP